MKSTLKELGLTEKEIRVYLALLSVGETSASVLAYKTSISPSTIHYLCDRLKERGLLNSCRNGNVIYYSPEGPEKIIYMLEREKCAIVHKEEAVHRIMGQLKALMNPKGLLPKVRFYQGLEGMVEAHREFLNILDLGGMVYHMVNPIAKNQDEMNKNLIKMFKKTREEKHFLYKGIMVDSAFSRKVKSGANLSDTEIILLKHDPKKHKHYYGSLVAKGIVLDINFTENDVLCTTIEHAGFSSMRQELFELAWEEAKRQAAE